MMACHDPESQHRTPRIRRRRRTLSQELTGPKLSPSVLRKKLDESGGDLVAMQRVNEWSRRVRDLSFPSHGVSNSSLSSPKCRKRNDENTHPPELICRCIAGIVTAHVVYDISTSGSNKHVQHPKASVFDSSRNKEVEVITFVGFSEGEIRVSDISSQFTVHLFCLFPLCLCLRLFPFQNQMHQLSRQCSLLSTICTRIAEWRRNVCSSLWCTSSG
jgi:hypothetical protein